MLVLVPKKKQTRSHSIFIALVIVFLCLTQASSALQCYECSDTFKTAWRPVSCQINATAVPSRLCNEEQQYCFVKRVTIKGIVSEIMRNCIDDCRYGCEATSFGITKITCVSCCDTDNCNTGNSVPAVHAHSGVAHPLMLATVIGLKMSTHHHLRALIS